MKNTTQLEVVFELDALDAETALNESMGILHRQGEPMEAELALNGKVVLLRDASSVLRRSRKRHFGLEIGKLEVHLSPISDSGFTLIHARHADSSRYINWEDWVSAFISHFGFVHAWVTDVNYEYWQNADDPLEFESEGRSYAGLPMMSNGLPSPLDKMIIDTRNNPGRRVIREGYVEAIGSTMWLSDKFWSLVGLERKEALLTSGIAEVSYPAEGVMRIQVADEPFRDTSNDSLQRQLRALIFGT